jgi:hypothetical protein
VLALAGSAIVAGLASGRPELVVLAAPTLLFVGVGLVLSSEPRLSAQIDVAQESRPWRPANESCYGGCVSKPVEMGRDHLRGRQLQGVRRRTTLDDPTSTEAISAGGARLWRASSPRPTIAEPREKEDGLMADTKNARQLAGNATGRRSAASDADARRWATNLAVRYVSEPSDGVLA